MDGRKGREEKRKEGIEERGKMMRNKKRRENVERRKGEIR